MINAEDLHVPAFTDLGGTWDSGFEQLRVGQVVRVRVVERNRWGLDVEATGGAGVFGFVDPVAISDEHIAGLSDYPPRGAVIEAVFLGTGAHGRNRFSLRRSDIMAKTRDGPLL